MTRAKILSLIALQLAVLLAMTGAAAAQSATPQPVACTVTPRSDAELASLGATPAAMPSTVTSLPAGGNVDKATFDAIQATLDQLVACQKAGNVNAVLALYTDAYVTNVALAPETVPIVQGTPEPSDAASASTPVPPSELTLALVTARSGPSDSVTGLVLYGSTVHVFIFTQEAGMLKIDQTGDFAGDTNGTPIAELPAPVQTAVESAAAKLGVDASTLTVVHSEQRDWPDASLGCPEPEKFYAQVITPGWLVLVSGGSQTLEYHTDANTLAVLCRTAAG
jgi:hypothetical protein